jgi:outer membrane protein OmpA-like peptidoglycan-associated protein
MLERIYQPAQAETKSSAVYAPGLLQRKCACGQHTTDQHGQCTECQKKGQLLQRRAVNQNDPGVAPPIVHELLRSPGRPLDPATRAFMEPHFGHDFSRVRVHTDAKAAESARAVNALAYTVNQDVVFNTGAYAPGTPRGRRLLAHELTHTVQQQNTPDLMQKGMQVAPCDNVHEREAEEIATLVGHGKSVQSHFTSTTPAVQRACGSATIGSVSGCIGVGGQDVYDLGVSSNSLYLFSVNCDEFLPGEEARLRTFASTITPEQTVEVHGFASEEGDSTFNDNLSCARALTAADILAQEGVAVPTTIFKHGATPGDRPDRRSVVISLSPPDTSPLDTQSAPSQPKTIIVIGSPSPDQAYGFQFVSAALCHSKDKNTTWLVEHSGYEMIYGTNPRFITDQAPAGGYGWITPSENLVGWINSMPDHSIGHLAVYSHGVPNQVTLRYGWSRIGMPDYGLNLHGITLLSPNKFTPNAIIEFNSCNTGTTTDSGNLAQAFANQVNRPVRAWTGRTSYSGINRGTCRVQGSTYSISRDAIREYWSRRRAGTSPQLRTFAPQRGTTP